MSLRKALELMLAGNKEKADMALLSALKGTAQKVVEKEMPDATPLEKEIYTSAVIGKL